MEWGCWDYLVRFMPLVVVELVVVWDLGIGGKAFFAAGFLEAILGASVSCSGFGGCTYFSSNSTKFARLRDVGIRFTRSSTRVRRLWACKAYCARSFRARSVTASISAENCL